MKKVPEGYRVIDYIIYDPPIVDITVPSLAELEVELFKIYNPKPEYIIETIENSFSELFNSYDSVELHEIIVKDSSDNAFISCDNCAMDLNIPIDMRMDRLMITVRFIVKDRDKVTKAEEKRKERLAAKIEAEQRAHYERLKAKFENE